MKLKLVLIIVITILLCCTTSSLSYAQEKERLRIREHVPKILTTKATVEPSFLPGATLTAYEFVWHQHAPEVAMHRLSGSISTMLDKSAAREKSLHEALIPVVEGEDAGTWVTLEHLPVLAKYQAEYNELRLIHREWDALNDPWKDIGEEEAHAKAERYLKQLAEEGVIDPSLYAQPSIQMGYKMVGAGSVEEPVQPGRVVEYRITFRPRLNGIELANAGVRLGILASGELASLRLGGVKPAGQWKDGRLQSTVKNSRREVRISPKELTDRFYRTTGKDEEVQIAWSRVMYVMPDGKATATLEPMFLISYTIHRNFKDQQVTSRRKTLAYSLTDEKRAPIDFDAPPAKHEEADVTRKE